VQVLP
jgi:hypothetical protein